MRNITLFIFSLICSLTIKAQLPNNILPNPSFEDGSTPQCNPHYNSGSSVDAWSFNSDISAWSIADPNPTSWFPITNIPDWLSIYCSGTTTCNEKYNIPLSKRFIGFQSHQGNGDGIKVSFANLASGKYKVRGKIRSIAYDNTNFIRVHLTNWTTNWTTNWAINDPSNPSIMNVAYLTFPSNMDQCSWYVADNIFEIPSDMGGKLGNLVFQEGQADYTNLDDVELFAYCTEQMIRQNRDYYLYAEKEEAGHILAGNTIATESGISWPTGDVHMHNGSKTIYKGYVEVDLKHGFTVDRGADFLARIAPCGQDCMPPDGTAGTNQSSCGGQTITLGSNPQRGCTYSWSAIPISALQYLSNTNTANPTFTPPTSGQGTIQYIVTITNQCGQSTQRTVTIGYDNNSSDVPNFTVTQSELISFNPSFTLNVDQHTEEVIVQLLDCNGKLIKEYPPYINGIDFTNNTFSWQFNDFADPCGCYQFKIKSKNYCSNV